MTTEAIERLLAHHIKPSAQRISIMDYMMTHLTHPTVDTIYSDLVQEMPTLSKTTIYNTLKLLAEHKAISELTIDKKTAHYDSITAPHSHFICKRCGRIVDVPTQETHCSLEKEGFTVEETEIYYRGICNTCKAKEQN